jgi:hypothetical protein
VFRDRDFLNIRGVGSDMMGTRLHGYEEFFSSGLKTGEELEEKWRVVVEEERSLEGRSEWRAPRVVAWDVGSLKS